MNRDDEIAMLEAQQRADDTSSVKRQRVGRQRVEYLEELSMEDEPSYEDRYDVESDEPNLNAELVAAVVAELSEQEREVYLMVYGEGLSLRQIEERLGVSDSTIQRVLRRVHARLLEVLEVSV